MADSEAKEKVQQASKSEGMTGNSSLVEGPLTVQSQEQSKMSSTESQTMISTRTTIRSQTTYTIRQETR